MILIIHTNNDFSTLEFIAYLKKKNMHHIALDINHILKSGMQIKDSLSNSVWSWKAGKEEISFSNISGIYNRIYYLPNCFSEYREEDIDYVYKEWWSYLVYRFANVNLCINPVSCALISGAIFNFIYYYPIAQKEGFNVPEYYISTSKESLQNVFNKNSNYIALNSLKIYNKFIPANNLTDDTIALVEHIKGKIIVVHVVDQSLYCRILNDERHYEPSDILSLKEQSMFFSLLNKLELKIMQVLLIKRYDNTLFLMNLTPFPNWQYNTNLNKNKIFEHLAQLLTLK